MMSTNGVIDAEHGVERKGYRSRDQNPRRGEEEKRRRGDGADSPALISTCRWEGLFDLRRAAGDDDAGILRPGKNDSINQSINQKREERISWKEGFSHSILRVVIDRSRAESQQRPSLLETCAGVSLGSAVWSGRQAGVLLCAFHATFVHGWRSFCLSEGETNLWLCSVLLSD